MMRAALVLAAAALLAPAAHAQSADHRFWLQGMVYHPAIDTTARVDSAGTSGADVDFEQVFRFAQRETLPSVTAGARLGRNWRLVGEVYSLDRQRSAVLDEDLQFDGVTYPVDAEVNARLGSDIYRVTAGYSFVNTPKLELGASLGAHVTSFLVSLEGEGSVNGQPATLEVRRRRVLAPLPTLGLYGEWRPTKRVLLVVRADALSIKLDDFRGKLLNLQASASYEVMPALALGVSWRRVRYRLDVDRADWTGRLRYRFDGPAAFIEWRFGGRG
jgi:hypothetical protein